MVYMVIWSSGRLYVCMHLYNQCANGESQVSRETPAGSMKNSNSENWST
jgi:hypothetical protein